ncbi:tetratricopeptide repeat protein [Kitasatospora sp. NPDC001574]
MSPAGTWPGQRIVAGGLRSVAVSGSNFAPITTGDHSPITTVRLPPLPAVGEVPPTPGPVGIPGPVPLFVGRADALSGLDRALSAGPGLVVHAVHGLGGVGKSALAAHYALTRTNRYTQVVWISADDPAGIEAGLRRFAIALEPVAQVLASEALVERALAWLAAHQDWLLVLDNVTAAGDLAPLLAALAGGGRILATSRSTVGWQRIGAGEQLLDSLGAEEAVRLLATSSKSGPYHPDPYSPYGPQDGGRELCEELGHLPLAIVQAGAYIAQTSSGARDFLALLAVQPATAYSGGDEETDPDRTVARIWRITLDRLADTPLAGEVLRVLAWFAPDEIPVTLLDGLARPAELAYALGRLTAYSMITRRAGTPGSSGSGARLAVHRLVQAVARTPDPQDSHRTPTAIAAARAQAAAQLAASLPGTPLDARSWSDWRAVAGHILALAEHAPATTDGLNTAGVLNQTGLFLRSQGDVAGGVACLRRARNGFLRLAGRADPQTLICTNNLADFLREAGEPGEAVRLFEQILGDMGLVFGEDHQITLRARHHLADAERSTGRTTRAIALLERTLADSRRVLGEDHPQTTSCRTSLALASCGAGDFRQGIPLLEQAFEDSRRAVGEEHPYTLSCRSNLAAAYLGAGRSRQALALLERAMADSLRVLGRDHPDTLTMRNNLAQALGAVAETERSRALQEQNLEECRRIHGANHRATLNARVNLAMAHLDLGDPRQAADLLRESLADARRILDADHPDVLAIARRLAEAYAESGDIARAVPLYLRTLTDGRRVLGDDNPEVIAVHAGLGRAHAEGGDPEEAVRQLEQALAGCLRVFGGDHPETLIARSDLAKARSLRGGPGPLLSELERIVADAGRVLGEDHPHYQTHCHVLAEQCESSGDLDRAVPLWERALAVSRRIYGDDDLETRLTERHLAALLRTRDRSW